MSNTPVQDPPAQGVSSSSGQTLPSRLLQPTSDLSASKRVCFYKSGDYKFSGHRMVINGRTFKTFDALLDALSKKVPLPFGVRTITTPRGTHHVRGLDDLQDGGSYVCSDQRRVKPLNLDEVNRRQVPWNTTRPFSAGRRKRQGPQFAPFSRRSDTSNRPARVTDRVAVRTPKRLIVIKNRDPSVKRTIVLQRRTAPTFDALLDYLSHILQFPVVKLYSTDGRRVDGLPALILCSGVIVAAGTEPFRLANYTFHRTGQTVQAMYMDPVEPPLLQPHTQNTKSFSSGRGSRNFSLSSERYIVNQINESRNGSRNMHRHNGSFETEVNQQHTSMDTCGSAMADNEPLSCNAPQDDDIEKSFRVNQDGSMTVEMKVRLTIKEEEMLHWTTTLCRSSLKRTVCASISESGNTSPDSNNAVAKESSSISEDEAKEENNSCTAGRGVGFNNEGVYEGYSPSALQNAKARFKRTPTPGPRHVKKKASVESVKTVTESGVQESTLGHYSYTERTADGETTEGYRVVRHSSSSSHRPIPKPRKTSSSGATNKGSHSSMRSTGVAEVLQIENNGMEIRETVMHIYETQGSYDNYSANEDYGADGTPSNASTPASRNRPPTDSGSGSSSNDCDIDFSSQQRQRDEMLSLSSEPVSTVHPVENDLSVVSENDGANSPIRLMEPQSGKDKDDAGGRKTKEIEPAKKKGSPSTSSSEKKLKGSTISLSKHSKRSSTDKLSSNTSVGKKSQSSSESARTGQKSKLIEKPQVKRSVRDEKKVSALLVKTPPRRQNMNKAAARDNGFNVNTPSGRPQMKKNMSDILQPKKTHFLGKGTSSKSKSVSENQIPSSRKSLELSETVSMPSLNPSPSEIHQYVENWLEEVTPDAVPYIEETATDEPPPQTKVIFQIGGDSESDEKTESQTNPEECEASDTLKKSSSCLSVPLSHEGPTTSLTQNKENSRGLCVSMPSVRVQPVPHENLLRSHKSAEAITPPAPDESSSSTSSILSPKAKIKPVLRQLCSSIQCIRTMSDTNTPGNLEKSNSLPDFSSQVVSVFGSSCKALFSFLSVMTLRDNLEGSVKSDEPGSRTSSEAMLMMESLQKISTIEDEEEQRSSLTDLQSRASSQLRERWKDFQILRERLESEPLSPKFSETEFALDVVSEGGDVFEDQHAIIDELMEELNMPQDLRDEISSTIHHVKSFYPVDESTFVETERYHSETEEDIEKFLRESDTDARQSPDPESVCIADNIKETRQENNAEGGDEDGNINDHEPEQDPDQVEDDLDKLERLTERDEDEAELKEEDGQIEEAEEGGKVMTDGRDDEGDENEGREREEGSEEETLKGHDDGQEEAEEGSGEESVVKEEEGTGGGITLDEEEVRERPEEDVVRETESRLTDEVEGRGSSSAETDERDCEDEEDDDEGQRGDGENVVEDEEGSEAIEEEEDIEEEEEEAGEVIEEEDQDEEVEDVDGDQEKDEEGEMEGMVQGRADKTEGVSEESSERDEEEEDDGEQAEEGVQLVEEEQREHIKEVEGEEEEEEEKEGEDDEEEGEQEQDEEEGVQLVEEEEEEQREHVEEVEEEEEKEEEEEEGDDEAEEEEQEQDEEEGVQLVEEEEEEEEQEETGELGVQSEDEEEHEEEQEEERAKEEEGAVELEEEAEEEEEGEQDREEEEGVELEEEEEGVQGEQEEEGEQDKEEEERVQLEEEEEEVQGALEEEGEQDREEEEGIELEEEEGVQGEQEEEGEQEKEEEEGIVLESEEEGEREELGEEGAELAEEEEGVQEELDEEEEGETEDEEEEGEQEEVEEGDNDQSEEEAVLKTIEENTDEEKEEGGTDQEIEDTERPDGDEDAKMAVIMEGESAEEKEDAKLGEESDGDEPNEGGEEEDEGAGMLCKGLIRESVRQEDEERDESPTQYSSNGRFEDDKGEGTDATMGSDEQAEERSSSRKHPVQISQELLDFVNSALQTSSLIFTYDDRGNIRIESDKARVLPAGLTLIPKSRKESSYGSRRLPSPATSDLSDYRPETSESGGYKTQESVDIVSGSGEEQSETPFPICRRAAPKPAKAERASSKLSAASRSGVSKSGGSFSCSTGAKASREDLSYFSGASSLKADGELAREATQPFDLNGGVLIDRGRWLLKENHLIRKSPPVSLGMYDNLDSTSMDTGQDNTSEESPPHYKTHHGPLAAISSSELEEMAKPVTPKCTYYNMLHSSDSDPFLDDSSVKSGKRGITSVQGRGFRVSPTIDTSKTWANKNSSLSSFTSVEFKVADRKVHPEGETSARPQARRTSSGGESSLQAQDAREALRLRCGQYCPIL